MKSALPKVLHPVAGLPMVAHVAKAATDAGSDRVAIVIGREADKVRSSLDELDIAATYHEQKERLGTAHAVKAASEAINEGHDDILVAFGDTPLVRAETLKSARKKLEAGADVVVIGFHSDNPTGYGRLIVRDGLLRAIREEKEASDTERQITFCNGGLMAFRGAKLPTILDAIRNHNTKGEYYLTDAVEIANSESLRVEAIEMPFEDVLGVNTRVELAEAESIWQRRKRHELMLAGVSMPAPDTVWFSHDTQIATDVRVEPNVIFGPGVVVEEGAVIHAFSHLEESTVGQNAAVGPYARLRPGADLRNGAKVGNFCEVKQAVVHEGAKINHLTYVGDAEIGANANIGAGTITCNYDGYNKFRTTIGKGAFIGSNSALVAPVTVGDNAYVASGSVVTEDVPADAVGFGRAKQVNKPGLAVKLREKFAAIKKAKSG